MKPKYLMGFLFCMLGLCLYLFYIIYSGAKENAIAELTNRQSIHAKQAKRGIEYLFSDLITYLIKISNSDHIINLDDQGKNELDLTLKLYPEAITAITRVDSTGILTFTIPYNADVIGQDISSQKHVKKILRTRKPVISDVFTAVQGYRAIALHVPVFKDKEFRGTLAVLINFSTIPKRFLQDIKLGKNGYSWMTSKEGIEIYCSIPGHTGKSVFENSKQFPGILSMADRMVQGKEGIASYMVDQIKNQKQKTVKNHAVYMPVKIADSFWTIVVVSSEDEVLASLISLKNKLMMVVCLLLFVSFLFSYSGMKAWGIVRESAIRQKAEKALEESEKKYKNIFENAVEGFFQSTPDGRFITVNPAFARMLGYASPEELITSIADIATQYYLNPEDRMQYRQILQKNGYVEHFEFKARCKDGSNIWVSNSTRAYFDPDGNIIRYEGTVQDITARKMAENALRESEEKYRTILESIEDGYYEVDMEGTFTFFNDSMGKILGYSKDELTGLNNRRYMDEENAKKVFETFNRVYKTGQPYKAIDWELIRKDGSRCFVETSVALKKNSKDQPIGFQGIARDISERKKVEKEKILLEKQLRQSQKMESIGTLTSGIAHDFNNLLYMISGNAELALEDTPKWTPVHTNLEEIKSASLRAAGIVKQLLNFSRKTDQKLEPLGAVAVIKDALKFLRSTIPTTIDIQQHLPETDITILADPVQINQILMNLCINAAHAMEATGGILKIIVEKVRLNAEEADSYPDLTAGDFLKIMVSDTGPGIASENINRIFDPYFTTKEIGKGSGMGLSIVHGIVKNHGGTVFVDSRPGEGTTFSLLFPVVDEKPEIETETIDELPRGHETILFVDDEQAITDMTQKVLERLGYKVEICLNPLQALDLFQSKPEYFDVVITDMTMPQMTGAKLSERLMEIRSDIPIIICTGHSSLINEENAKQLGIADYVMKPVSMSRIAKAIRKILDK